MTLEGPAAKLMRERIEIGVPIPTDIARGVIAEMEQLASSVAAVDPSSALGSFVARMEEQSKYLNIEGEAALWDLAAELRAILGMEPHHG